MSTKLYWWWFPKSNRAHAHRGPGHGLTLCGFPTRAMTPVPARAEPVFCKTCKKLGGAE